MAAKYKILDLFCCSGGAAMGYSQSGFAVTGVDNKEQPNYPFSFIKADAIDILRDIKFVTSFDALHASPPCQGYSHATKNNSKYVPYSQGKQTPKLIQAVRELIPFEMPYVIENVAGAKNELKDPFALTGFLFGMPIERKRYFETNILFPIPELPKMRGFTKRYAEQHGIDYRDMTVTGKSRRKGCIDLWKEIMRMPWAGRAWELSEAIPPPYTKFIGDHLINHIINNSR